MNVADVVISNAVVFLLIMDPLGNVPLFLAALRHTTHARRRRILIRELLIAFAIMVLFLFGGQGFMTLFQISQSALTTAGGVILMLIALRMIFPSPTANLKETIDDEPFIVPLAVPYVAGPSLLAMEIVAVSREPDFLPWLLLALFAAWLLSALALYFSSALNQILGEKTLTAVERLMGMVLVIVATQMTLDGIAEYFSL